MDFNESQTKENLAKAFAAECQAGARYQFMATQAQNEQLPYVQGTMKMLAKNEMAHAKLFYDYIVDNGGECKVEVEADYPYVEATLEKSLKAEAEVEAEEFERIYPHFSEVAKREGYKDIAESFNIVAAVEKTHSKILEFLAKNYSKQSFYKSKTKRLLKCSNCGHIDCLTDGWTECPLCSLGTGYIQIDYNDILKNSLEC